MNRLSEKYINISELTLNRSESEALYRTPAKVPANKSK